MALLTATQTMGLVWERTHPRVPARPCSKRQPAPHLVPEACSPAGPCRCVHWGHGASPECPSTARP